MAESTFSNAFDDLKSETGYYAGYGRTESAWSSKQSADIVQTVKKALRRFYYSSRAPGQENTHRWTFLRPVASFVAWQTVPVTAGQTVTGVYDSDAGTTTLTANASVFYSTMKGKSVVITDIGTFTIASYTSATVVVLTGDATCSGKTFSITADGDYPLPDDFGQLVGPIVYTTDGLYPPLRHVGEAIILQRRSYNSQTSTHPCFVAITAVPRTSEATGTRWRLMLDPYGGDDYTFKLRYTVLADSLTDDDGLPYGGALHAEVIMQACRAQAELDLVEGAAGSEEGRYQELLDAAIASDRGSAPDTLGQIYDPSNYMPDGRMKTWGTGSGVITYNGVEY